MYTYLKLDIKVTTEKTNMYVKREKYPYSEYVGTSPFEPKSNACFKFFFKLEYLPTYLTP